MTKINGINFNEPRENPPEKSNQESTSTDSKKFEELFSVINNKEIVQNLKDIDFSEYENNIIQKNSDMKIFIDNDTGKINKIENYQIQINIIPNNETKNNNEETAFTDYMAIISALNKISHNIA